MAELAQVKRIKSGLGDGILKVSSPDYHRQYYLHNRDKRAEYRTRNYDARAGYHREYYRQNKDKNAEYYILNNAARAEYDRGYKLKNQDRNTEYCNRNSAARVKYNRQYYLRSIDKNEEFRSRASEAKLEYHRLYNFQNKDKISEYSVRNDDSRAHYQQLYSRGKKEFFRLSSGHLRSNQSWKSPDLVRQYFDSVASQLNISNFVDWYRISRRQVHQYGGFSLYSKFGSLGAALQFAYPEINWDLTVFSSRGKKSGQRWLKMKIAELLPGIEVTEDYQHPDLSWVDDSDRNMELDLWIPEYRIGIEFQGEQHYCNVDSFGPSNGTGSYWERDQRKNLLCKSQGITLIAIPYWWDGSLDSLSATLYRARPDVFPVSDASPIPLEKPANENCPDQSRTTGKLSVNLFGAFLE